MGVSSFLQFSRQPRTLEMWSLHVITLYTKYSSLSNFSSSVPTTNPVLTKFAPNMYFGSQHMQENLFWKNSSKSTLILAKTILIIFVSKTSLSNQRLKSWKIFWMSWAWILRRKKSRKCICFPIVIKQKERVSQSQNTDFCLEKAVSVIV